MQQILKIRLNAFLLHLLLSLLIIGTVIGGLVYYFLPGIFLYIDGIGTALQILIWVDIIIGPVLTFLIYQPGKKWLKLDIAIICLLQATALAYGAWAIYDSRPAYLIFYGDTFYLANHKQIDQSRLQNTSLAVGALDRPTIVTAQLQGTAEQRFLMAMESMSKGEAIQYDAMYFIPFDKTDPRALERFAIKPEKLFSLLLDKETDKAAKYTDQDQYLFFTLVGHEGEMILVLDRQSMQIVDALQSRQRPKRQ